MRLRDRTGGRINSVLCTRLLTCRKAVENADANSRVAAFARARTLKRIEPGRSQIGAAAASPRSAADFRSFICCTRRRHERQQPGRMLGYGRQHRGTVQLNNRVAEVDLHHQFEWIVRKGSFIRMAADLHTA